MDTETKLREAMKVVVAAQNYRAAVNGRSVRIAQDRLYEAVNYFDRLNILGDLAEAIRRT